jgi:AAA+ ATPase superfamily predicted ATPase
MVTLDEIFQYLGQADRPCIIAIDEFQQITRYAEAHNIEAMLRTYIQRCNNATFIFSGSKRHLMGEIFTSPSRPFYQSVLVMNLKPISVEKYTEFAKMQFDRYGKSIEDEAVVTVYERFDAVTSCLQRILNVLFLKTLPGGKCTCDMVDDAINYILDMFSETYQDLLERIPEKQREVFIAIAKEGKAKAITGKTFIKKHHLQTSSVINAAVRGLLEKDFITVDKGVYTIYDPFFALWLRNGR